MKPREPKRRTPASGGFFDIPGKQEKLKALDDKVNADPNFWSDPIRSAPVLKDKKVLELALQRAKKLTATRDDLNAALELAAEGDDDYLKEANALFQQLNLELQALEVQSLLGGELDLNDAVVTINSGAGGYRVAGLGLDAVSHVPALCRA